MTLKWRLQISDLSINVSGFNSSTKRKIFSRWLTKQDPTICGVQEIHLNQNNSDRPKIEACANGNDK